MIRSNALVATFVLEYDDKEAAEEGFAAASAVWEETLEASSPDVEIGDEQLLFAGTGIDTNAGSNTSACSCSFAWATWCPESLSTIIPATRNPSRRRSRTSPSARPT